MNLKFV